jgi:hypothetical protein
MPRQGRVGSCFVRKTLASEGCPRKSPRQRWTTRHYCWWTWWLLKKAKRTVASRIGTVTEMHQMTVTCPAALIIVTYKGAGIRQSLFLKPSYHNNDSSYQSQAYTGSDAGKHTPWRTSYTGYNWVWPTRKGTLPYLVV